MGKHWGKATCNVPKKIHKGGILMSNKGRGPVLLLSQSAVGSLPRAAIFPSGRILVF